MNWKRTVIVLTAALWSVTACLGGCTAAFRQYNQNGVSNYLNIVIDPEAEKKKAGTLEERTVWIEGLDTEFTFYKTADGKRLAVDEVLKDGLVSIEDWRKAALKTVSENGTEILKFENYEIAVSADECIIRPLSK